MSPAVLVSAEESTVRARAGTPNDYLWHIWHRSPLIQLLFIVNERYIIHANKQTYIHYITLHCIACIYIYITQQILIKNKPISNWNTVCNSTVAVTFCAQLSPSESSCCLGNLSHTIHVWGPRGPEEGQVHRDKWWFSWGFMEVVFSWFIVIEPPLIPMKIHY